MGIRILCLVTATLLFQRGLDQIIQVLRRNTLSGHILNPLCPDGIGSFGAELCDYRIIDLYLCDALFIQTITSVFGY